MMILCWQEIGRIDRRHTIAFGRPFANEPYASIVHPRRRPLVVRELVADAGRAPIGAAPIGSDFALLLRGAVLCKQKQTNR